jgi:hypothetical protein
MSVANLAPAENLIRAGHAACWYSWSKDFGRFLPVERLSWTVVELVGDGVEFGLCVARQVGFFRKVLTQEPIGVLVASPLPG